MASKQQSQRRVRRSIPTVGCLFSAIGGFAAAFKRSGANVVWANEKDAHAVATFRHNFPDVECIHKPVEEVTVAGDASIESIEKALLAFCGFLPGPLRWKFQSVRVFQRLA